MFYSIISAPETELRGHVPLADHFCTVVVVTQVPPEIFVNASTEGIIGVGQVLLVVALERHFNIEEDVFGERL